MQHYACTKQTTHAFSMTRKQHSLLDVQIELDISGTSVTDDIFSTVAMSLPNLKFLNLSSKLSLSVIF